MEVTTGAASCEGLVDDGSGPVDGGTGPVNAACSALAAGWTRFFAGRPVCSTGSGAGFISLSPATTFRFSTCLSAYPTCSASEQTTIANFTTCLSAGPQCTAGNEATALDGLSACPTGSLSPACVAVFRP